MADLMGFDWKAAGYLIGVALAMIGVVFAIWLPTLFFVPKSQKRLLSGFIIAAAILFMSIAYALGEPSTAVFIAIMAGVFILANVRT